MGEFLKQRADEFFEGAQHFLKEGKYNLAAFHLEQAVQLNIKYRIYCKLGDWPQLHPLDKLLEGFREGI